MAGEINAVSVPGHFRFLARRLWFRLSKVSVSAIMECDTSDRDLEAQTRGRSRLMPGNREFLIAPVMDAEVTERTLEAMKCLFECLHALHLQKNDRLWKPIVKVDDGFKACKAFLQALVS